MGVDPQGEHIWKRKSKTKLYKTLNFQGQTEKEKPIKGIDKNDQKSKRESILYPRNQVGNSFMQEWLEMLSSTEKPKYWAKSVPWIQQLENDRRPSKLSFSYIERIDASGQWNQE